MIISKKIPLFINNYFQSRESFSTCMLQVGSVRCKKKRNCYACAERDYLLIEVQGKKRFNTEARSNYYFSQIVSLKKILKIYYNLVPNY